MKIEPDFIFEEMNILNALDEIKDSSTNSGLFTKSKIQLSVYPDWPNSKSGIEIKPYDRTEDLDAVRNYKHHFSNIGILLPFKQKVRKELDLIYEKDRLHTLDGRAYISVEWKNLSNKKRYGNYYRMRISGRSLCDNRGEQFEKAINDPKTYESFRCSNKICPDKINSFCKDLTETLNKYSYPKNVKFKK